LGLDRLVGITHCQASCACRIITAPLPPGRLCPAARRLTLPLPGSTVSRRQAPLHHQGLCCTIPLGGTLPTARRPARTVTTVIGLCPVRLAARTRCQAPYQLRTVTGFLALKHIPMGSQSYNTN